MTKVIIDWQNQFGGWYRFQEQHHEPSAYRTAEQRANRLNKKTHEAKPRNHNQSPPQIMTKRSPFIRITYENRCDQRQHVKHIRSGTAIQLQSGNCVNYQTKRKRN